MGWDKVVHILTHYGLDNLGIESRWGKISHNHSDQPWDAPRLLYKGFQVFPGEVKRLGPGVGHQTHLALRLKKK
jgi:hypothetical protein